MFKPKVKDLFSLKTSTNNKIFKHFKLSGQILFDNINVLKIKEKWGKSY